MTKYILIAFLLVSCVYAQEINIDLNAQTTMITEVKGDTVTVYPSKGPTLTYIGKVNDLFAFIEDTSYLRIDKVQAGYYIKTYIWKPTK